MLAELATLHRRSSGEKHTAERVHTRPGLSSLFCPGAAAALGATHYGAEQTPSPGPPGSQRAPAPSLATRTTNLTGRPQRRSVAVMSTRHKAPLYCDVGDKFDE
ncbi:unnamed protein product [Ostreobium quekettii]|uniref:Uncharacterized protein n=1 Tax=Ostreobium quekettii TaxID=121088 RepID=A0A8S1ISD6_9CHLO|nr:unnamed protein product [Ostreobium quekettii]